MEIKQDNYYKLIELQELTQITIITLRKYIKADRLKASKIGKEYLVKGGDFIEFIENNKVRHNNKRVPAEPQE